MARRARSIYAGPISAYRMVTSRFRWPSSFCRVCKSIPLMRAQHAKVWRRSWNRTSFRPARRTTRRHMWLITLLLAYPKTGFFFSIVLSASTTWRTNGTTQWFCGRLPTADFGEDLLEILQRFGILTDPPEVVEVAVAIPDVV